MEGRNREGCRIGERGKHVCTSTHFKRFSLICEELENSETKKKGSTTKELSFCQLVSQLVRQQQAKSAGQPAAL